MISVIIPVRNEAETITSVVAFARQSPRVREVIVIDDGSIDGTPELARAAGALVLTSTLLGKGASMADGVVEARGEILLYLDGDLLGLQENLVTLMTDPIFRDDADFVKARFSRVAGRVTTLTARPLLRTFFPELARFEQPLGGIIAARRSLLQRLRFENDYGVDVGLLIDASFTGARLVEVDIGRIEHDSQPLELLGDMASQVVRTVLNRAARYGRLKHSHIREMEEAERQDRADQPIHLKRGFPVQKLALFDMDGTLLRGRFVVNLAQRTNLMGELETLLDNQELSAYERTCRIAAVFEGVPRKVFEQAALDMPLNPGAVETVVGLQKAGYRVGIVTDSYCIVSEIVRRRVFADFALSNLLKFRHGRASGQVAICPAFRHPYGCQEHSVCKVNVLSHFADQYGLRADQVLAVGDGENDVCLLKAAGASFTFNPKTRSVEAAAQCVVQEDLREILPACSLLPQELCA